MAARDYGTVTLLCLALAACGRGGQEVADRTAPDTLTTVPEEPPLSDSQALDVLMAMSAAGVRAADSVPEAVATPEVRRYLNVVRADHQALLAELKVIADSLQLAPEPNPAGEQLRAAAQDARLLLAQQAYGAADAATLQQQVRLNALFLGVLDSSVMRGARQRLLAQYATAVRPTISAHLQRAEQLERLLAERPTPVRSATRPRTTPIDTPPRPRPAALELGRRPPPDTVPAR